jgi:hypothetical protein
MITVAKYMPENGSRFYLNSNKVVSTLTIFNNNVNGI